MEQLLGFIDKNSTDHVCLLKKSLYDLKQAPLVWFDRLSRFLLHLGFHCSRVDSSLFIPRIANIFTLILIYIDDVTCRK